MFLMAKPVRNPSPNPDCGNLTLFLFNMSVLFLRFPFCFFGPGYGEAGERRSRVTRNGLTAYLIRSDAMVSAEELH